MYIQRLNTVCPRITVEAHRNYNIPYLPIVFVSGKSVCLYSRDTPRLFLDLDQTPYAIFSTRVEKDSQPSLGDFFLRVTHDMHVHIYSEVRTEYKCSSLQ